MTGQADKLAHTAHYDHLSLSLENPHKRTCTSLKHTTRCLPLSFVIFVALWISLNMFFFSPPYREKLIAENMAKMPKMIADWRKEKQEAKRKQKEEKAKKERLLAEVRERFGYALDPRSSKFQEMLAEIEKEEKKKRKLLKRQKREEEQGLTTSAPAAESS